MIPLHDDNPRVMTPFVNYGLIALNLVVFFHQFTLQDVDLQAFVYTYGAIPSQITGGEGYFSLFTSMFLHGGLLHLLSNMLYLYIFGDNIEGLMGHGRYLLFYILSGLGAAASHIFIELQSAIPMIGASGAISGVLGAYLLKFPRAKVLILFWIIIFINTIRVPAIIVLGLWFFMQLSSGLSSLGVQSGGGVAWFAHIGGFVVGLVLVKFFEKQRVIKTEW